MDTYQVQHDPEGYACNMGYVVIDTRTDAVRYRGPQWAAEHRASQWNQGQLTMTERLGLKRARALRDVLASLPVTNP